MYAQTWPSATLQYILHGLWQNQLRVSMVTSRWQTARGSAQGLDDVRF